MAKVALITGASRGIGRATAEEFAKAGYQVAANFCSSGQAVEEFARQMAQQGCSVLPCQADVSDPQQVEQMVQTVLQQFGHIDVLVCNAGIARQGLLTDFTQEDWHPMNKKTYRGVIFDLDGTLLDTSEGVFASVRHTVEALGKPALDEATLRTFIGPPVKLSLIRLYGLDEDAANHATEIFRTQYKDHDLLKAEPYAGIKDLIRALRAQGCKIGVATLKREDYALTLLEHYHFTELCDSICGSDFASKMTKADVLHKCLKALELSPSEAVLIGDTSSDGKGAKEAAVDFMAVTYGFGPDTAEAWQEYAPVYTAKDTHDIGAFLGVNF